MTLSLFALLFVACLIPFIVTDAIWLTFVTAPEFRATLGGIMRDTPNWTAALLFYALYGIGLVFLVAGPAIIQGTELPVVFGLGVCLGLVAYGTYELTNMATLSAWTWKLVLLDTAWGAALTGFASTLGVWLVRSFGPASGGAL
ncbi:MAG: DUF2177 family protein [Pseudomonadota bacterium]